MSLEPVSVALKFGFIAVMYLFLLWISRSALVDLRRSSGGRRASEEDATGIRRAVSGPLAESHPDRVPRLIVERAPGHVSGMIYDLDGGAILGRGGRSDIRLQDPFASSHHARISEQGGILLIEDLGSTNGTRLNGEMLDGPRPLHPGDRVRIGDSEFTYEAG